MGFIKLVSVSKEYCLGDVRIHALKDVSLSIDKGAQLCIMGPNGSGKTTLLKIMAGYLRPTSGHVYVDGMDLTELKHEELVVFRRRKVGFIFQENLLLESLTIYENLDLALRRTIPNDELRSKSILEALSRLGIKRLKDRLYGKLSMGERRKAVIALAISNKPKILFADEPTSNLDVDSIDEVIEIFRDLNKEGVTVIVSTHDVILSRYFRDKIFLRDGRIVYSL